MSCADTNLINDIILSAKEDKEMHLISLVKTIQQTPSHLYKTDVRTLLVL